MPRRLAITHHLHHLRKGKCVRLCLVTSDGLGSATSGTGIGSLASSSSSPLTSPPWTSSRARGLEVDDVDGEGALGALSMKIAGLTGREQQAVVLIIDSHASENPQVCCQRRPCRYRGRHVKSNKEHTLFGVVVGLRRVGARVPGASIAITPCVCASCV